MKNGLKLLLITLTLTFTSCVTTSKVKPEQSAPAATLTFADQSVKIDAYWETSPSVEPEQKLRLEVRDITTGKRVPAPSDISVSVWMKTHSYGLVEPTVEPAKDKDGRAILGVYEAKNIYFLAQGQWEVRIYMGDKENSNPMQKFLVDLGEEKLNPINDPKSHMYRMMNPNGGEMDHSKHGHMNHDAPKKEEKGKEKQ